MKTILPIAVGQATNCSFLCRYWSPDQQLLAAMKSFFRLQAVVFYSIIVASHYVRRQTILHLWLSTKEPNIFS